MQRSSLNANTQAELAMARIHEDISGYKGSLD
jgi:hypothetical protein